MNSPLRFSIGNVDSELSGLPSSGGPWQDRDVERTSFTRMGYTMRGDRYLYTECVVWNGTTLSPVWDQVKSTELYDHE